MRATSTIPPAKAAWRTCSSTWPSREPPQIGTTDYAAEKVALAKVEAANNAYEAEYLKPVGRDEQKLAELKKAFLAAQAEAEKYVIPNQFTEVAEANGADGLNAETGLDDTQYYWSMPENRLELWAWMESSRLADAVPREFYKERDVVMEERRMRVDSDPIGRLVEQFLATAYVAHNYGRSDIGWPSEVSQITATEAMAFHKKYYVGGNIVVAIVGDVDAKTDAADAREILQPRSRRAQAGRHDHRRAQAVCREIGRHPRADAAVLYRGLSPAQLSAIPTTRSTTPSATSCRTAASRASIAASSSSSRSPPRPQGFSPFPGEKYPSLFAFYAVPLPGHTPAEMRDAIHKEIEKLKTTDVTDAELEMYKTRARADLLRGLADNQGLANSLAEYQTRYGDWRELFLQLDRVDKVTKADIRRVANQVFVASNRTSAEIDTEPPAADAKKTEARNERNGNQGQNSGISARPR